MASLVPVKGTCLSVFPEVLGCHLVTDVFHYTISIAKDTISLHFKKGIKRPIFSDAQSFIFEQDKGAVTRKTLHVFSMGCKNHASKLLPDFAEKYGPRINSLY